MNANGITILETQSIDAIARLFRVADGWLWSRDGHTTECEGPFDSREAALASHAAWTARRSRPITIGEELTIQTSYGMLPGIHRGRVTRRLVGELFELSVFVEARGRYETVAFQADQIVADSTPTTTPTRASAQQFEREYTAAMAWDRAHGG
jgi:hypothetical protein